jgi:citrate lyase synthetase
MDKIIFVNEEKDKKILFRAMENSNVTSFSKEMVFLEGGEELFNKLCEIIRQKFDQARKLGAVISHRES